MNITEMLIELKDENNAAFQAKLTPGIPPEYFLGIKVPVLREIAKKHLTQEESDCFIAALPHRYYDENMLHSVILSNIKDFDYCMTCVNAFLPYVDNWAVCDTLSPKVFGKNKSVLLEKIKIWTSSGHTYTCRFGIDMLMTHFLDADFRPEYLELPAQIITDDYYINMMTAWYFATALAKQWDCAVLFFENNKLPKWVHNKAIQKARESYRITDEQKNYLKDLKRQ